MTHNKDAAAFDPSQVMFVTRGVTPIEAAAVTAVLRGLLQEESDDARSQPEKTRSAWEISQRSVRAPLTPGAGRWRSFVG